MNWGKMAYQSLKMVFFSSGTCLAASNPTTSANPCYLCLHRFDHCNTIFIYIIIIYKKYSVITNKGMMKMLKIIISIIIQFPFITNVTMPGQPLHRWNSPVPFCLAAIKQKEPHHKVSKFRSPLKMIHASRQPVFHKFL